MSIVAAPPIGRQADPVPDLDLTDRRDRQFAALVALDDLAHRCGGRFTPLWPLRDDLDARTHAVAPTLSRVVRLLLDSLDAEVQR
jgi:hypothetical protein